MGRGGESSRFGGRVRVWFRFSLLFPFFDLVEVFSSFFLFFLGIREERGEGGRDGGGKNVERREREREEVWV